MYANLATAWEGPHAFARAGAPPAFLQRYFDYYAGPSNYVNHHHPPAQNPWPASHLAIAPQPWSSASNDASYTQRQLPYVADDVRTTVPHASPPARQLHHESSAAPAVSFDAPGPAYRSIDMKNTHQPVRYSTDVGERSLTFR